MAPRKKKEIEEKEELVRPPVKTMQLVGHKKQLAEMESNFNSSRRANSWLVSGERGVGKATCVYNIVRRLLAMASKDNPLPQDAGDALAHRIGEGGHSDIKIIEAQDGKEITIDAIRDLQNFMHLTAGESAWRVAVIDGAESMNNNAANALLKLLEEPPASAFIFLISHSSGRLLPTIRSRCRKLSFMPLSVADFKTIMADSGLNIELAKVESLYKLSHGSPGLAIKLHLAGAVGLYEDMLAILKSYPQMSVPAQLKWADKVAARQNPENWEAAKQIFMHVAHGLAMARHKDGDEAAVFRQVAAAKPLDYWHSLWENTGALLADNDILHFDARQVALEFFHKLKAA